MNGISRVTAFGIGRQMIVGLGFLALALVMGCGGSALPPVHTEMVPFTPDQQSSMKQARSAEYRLRTGDRLAIDFKYEDELDSTQLLILPDGRLTLPGGVDPVMARGLTVTGLDSILTARYAVDYREPDLSVIVEHLADLHVYVFGYVKGPGQVKLPQGPMGVMRAIASAGGFDSSAAPKETVVMRVTEDGFMLRRIDLSHLERRGIPDFAALDLQPFDIVYVPRSTVGDIEYFSNTILKGLVSSTRLFWDVYAISHINQVTSLYR